MKKLFVLLFCSFIYASAVLPQLSFAASLSNIDVPIWQPYDFVFKAAVSNENPFLVNFEAMVIGPNGKLISIPGFYNGNGEWIIRVSPTAEGEWKIITKSSQSELNGKGITFSCVKNNNSKVHGILEVDKKHPHHFIFEDGTHFFMQGYEYDWLFALDMDKKDVPTIDKTLDIISSYGFDYVLMDSYAYDTKWRTGKTGPDDYGPPLMCPWEGSNEKPNYNRMNLSYWNHFDKVIDALYERGMEAHIFIKVYNKEVNWPKDNSQEEKFFFTWLIARYSAYPNIIWDLSKEAQREKDSAYKQGMLKFIRANDPYHHLMTVHDDDTTYDSGAYDSLLDFRADQQHKNYHDTIIRERAQNKWPVANVESDYECGPGGIKDKTYNSAHTTDQTIRTLWEIAMAGGYTGYYYTYTAWDVIHPFDIPPGYEDMKHFKDFWQSSKYWQLQPSDSLVSEGYCLADPGKEYIVYEKDVKPITLNISSAKGNLTGEWFNPYTGKTYSAGTFDNGTVKINPPDNWGSDPVILHLKQD